jgi:hypothetical protein
MDEPVSSVFGQQIVWTKDNPRARNTSLNGNALKYEETTSLAFDRHMNCTSRSGECAADGDVIETVLALSSPLSSIQFWTKVIMKTTVVALVSCDNTKVRVTQDGRALDGDVAPSASVLHVHVAAKDADDLNVTATRADLNLQWGNLSVEFQRFRARRHARLE